MRNKKASLLDPLILMIIAFVILVFLGVWMYGYGIAHDSLSSINITLSDSGGSHTQFQDIVEDTSGQYNSAMQQNLKYIALAIFFGMVMLIFVTNYFQKSHPFVFIIYIMGTVLFVIVAVYISNTYETYFLNSSILGPTFLSFTGMNFIMINLPVVIGIISLLGGFFIALNNDSRNEFGLVGGV